MSKTLLENAWLKLDVAVAELHEGTYSTEEVTRMKGVCRGMAEIIALFMKPHFSEGDEVVREAQKRYKAKKAGEDYETPGLGSQRFVPPPGTKNPTQPAKEKKPSHKLGDKEIAAIKAGLESGMFQPEDLAKMYGVSAAIIEEVSRS
jgi:hypothetical protein